MRAAKKHQMEAVTGMKKTWLMKHAIPTTIPSIHIYGTLEMRNGSKVAMRYISGIIVSKNCARVFL